MNAVQVPYERRHSVREGWTHNRASNWASRVGVCVDWHHAVLDSFSSNVVINRGKVLDKADLISRAVNLELHSESIIGYSLILGHK